MTPSTSWRSLSAPMVLSKGSHAVKYQDLGVRPVVSAQANSTPLGGCTLSNGVVQAMNEAARHHVDMDGLWLAAGRMLAEATGAEDDLARRRPRLGGGLGERDPA